MNLEEYNNIFNYKTFGILPDHLSPELYKRFKSNTESYFIRDNQLYKINKSDPDRSLLVIKVTILENILFEGHSKIYADYFEIENIFYKISRKYY